MHNGLLTRGDSFARDLANLRQQQKLSEEELAESAGCTPQEIRRYESGERRPQDNTVEMFNHILVGRDRWGTKVIDVPQGRYQPDLKTVSDAQLVAELQRRLSPAKSE